MRHWKVGSTDHFAKSAVLGLMIVMVGAACSGAGGGGGNGSATTITVAAVDNPQMADLKQLLPTFESAHSDIKVNIVTLPEDQLRDQVTKDVAANSGKFDLFTIGTYEVPLWAKKGWIENLSPYVAKDSSYAPDDLIPGIKTALSYNGGLYAVPFYGESSMLMYRKDFLQAAGVTMPDHPTWDQVAAAARAVNNSSHSGICLRGLPGWGEQLAPLDTVVNTYGGRWFDQSWNPQLTTPAWHDALSFYVNLLKSAGEPGPTSAGFVECLNAYNSGKVAMWYDATVGASNFQGDAAKNSGYAFAPTKVKDWSGWLWAWSLGMPSSSKKKDAAWAFADWATSKDYIKLVGTKLGWSHVPPGTRTSTYSLPDYQQAAGGFAQVTLDSIAHADVTHATVDPVPYIGIQYVDVDEFQALGDQVSQEFAKVITGGESVDAALQNANKLAAAVGKAVPALEPGEAARQLKIASRSILPPVVGRGGVRGTTAASISRREAWARRLPFLPAFIYVFLVTQIPFALTVYYSFFSWNLLKPGSFHFAGLDNYANILTNDSIRIAVWNTVLLTASVIAISVVLGMGVALLLNSEIFGKGLLRTLMIAPFLIMPTAAALIWKDTLLNPLFGLIPYLLSPFGLGRVDFVGQFPMVTVVTVEVWRWTPFMMLIILAGLQSQNPEVLEAARVDGANAFQSFRRITLPLVRPFIELGALLGSLFVVQTFDSIYMLTFGGPGEDTTNIPFLLYLVAFQGYSIGQASAIGVVAVIITIVVATFALRTLFSIFQVEARR